MESVKFATSGQKYQQKRSVRSLISFWFFGHDFFQERTSKPKIIVFGHQEHLNGSFCVVFIFHASLIWSVRYSNKTAKNDKSGMVTLLFEGSAYNTSRYFAHCSYFSSTLWGSRKYRATCKIFPRIIMKWMYCSCLSFSSNFSIFIITTNGITALKEAIYILPGYPLNGLCHVVRLQKLLSSAYLIDMMKWMRKRRSQIVPVTKTKGFKLTNS